MIPIILVVSLFLSLLLGVPIGFGLGLSSLIALLAWQDIPLVVIVQRTFTGIDIFPIMAVPLFILAGELIKAGNMMGALLNLSNLLVGHIRGGLAHVNVVVSMFFGGVTGSAVADTSALGSIEIPMMRKAGYDAPFSAAITCASAIIGPIIPPSILMVVYAMAVPNVGVGALFLGGVIPGLVVGLSLLAANYYLAVKRNYPKEDYQLSFSKLIRTLRKTVWALMMPVIIMGGIISGAFTATEAAGIAVLYALIVGLFISRDLNFTNIVHALFRSGVTAGSVLIIVAFANLFAWLLTTQQVPQKTAALMLGLTQNPYMFLLLINILLLILGCFVEGAAAIIIIAPIFAPIAVKLGIDPLHFGIVFVINLCIGLITPPMGLTLFVGCGIANISLEEISKAIVPFLIVEIAVLFLVTYVPAIPLFLPNLIMR
jgi:tripartite ATP-independent transporter DctM subunit